MRHCFLTVVLVILNACSSGLLQPASTPDLVPAEAASTDAQSTPAPTPPVQFVQGTPTRIPVNTETILPTASGREFENGLPLAARVNHQPIFLSSYHKQLAQFEQAVMAQGGEATANNFDQLNQTVLDGLIAQLIIEQQAQPLGISVSDAEVEAKAQDTINQLQNPAQFETWLANNNLTYPEFVAQLRTQLISSRVVAHVTQHVPNMAEQVWLRTLRVDDEASAQVIIERLKQGERFVDVANSPDGVGNAENGDLGWLPKETGLIPPEVEAIAFTMQPGEVAGPVQTQTGIYIIKVEGKEANKLLTNGMQQLLKSKIFAAWLEQHQKTATIEKFVDP